MSESEEKFETFSGGIKKLKELEDELKLLDTKGFEKEVNSIKAKLNDADKIPEHTRVRVRLLRHQRSKFPFPCEYLWFWLNFSP